MQSVGALPVALVYAEHPEFEELAGRIPDRGGADLNSLRRIWTAEHRAALLGAVHRPPEIVYACDAVLIQKQLTLAYGDKEFGLIGVARKAALQQDRLTALHLEGHPLKNFVAKKSF